MARTSTLRIVLAALLAVTSQALERAVLKGIMADLGSSGQAVAMKYTFGQGNTGMEREVYCAAWFVMGGLIASGKTLPELARIPEARMVETIRSAMTD